MYFLPFCILHCATCGLSASSFVYINQACSVSHWKICHFCILCYFCSMVWFIIHLHCEALVTQFFWQPRSRFWQWVDCLCKYYRLLLTKLVVLGFDLNKCCKRLFKKSNLLLLTFLLVYLLCSLIFTLYFFME